MAGNEPFASRLKAARLRKGARLKAAGQKGRFTQEKLGIAVGIAEESANSRMNHYEQGRHLPDLEMAKRLANELEVPLAYLFCEEDNLAELLLLFSGLPIKKKKQAVAYLADLSGDWIVGANKA